MTQFLIPPPGHDPNAEANGEAPARAPEEQEQPYDDEYAYREGTGRLIPIIVILLIVAGIGAWFGLRGTEASNWHDDLYGALDIGQAEQRPVFVLFTADWCPPCKKLKADTLAHPDVLDELDAQFVCVKMDLTDDMSEHNAVARELSVSSIPAMHVYDGEGNRLAQHIGYMDPGTAVGWLQDARSGR